MKIGPYVCRSIISNRLKLDGGAMFGVVPKTLWSRHYPADEYNRISMVTRLLLLIGKDDVILVDSGTGGRWEPKYRDIYGIEEEFSLADSLADHGLTVNDVSYVIHSHLHFDHCGGSVIDSPEGPRPRFPNARYIVHREHFRWACSPTARDRASFRPSDFLPLQEAGLLELVDEGFSLPNIELIPAMGHTPYQLLPRIYDDRNSLLYCGDMIPLADQIQAPWIMSYDLFPLETLKEKTRILEQAADEGWILFFEHDADTEAVTLTRGPKGIAADRRFRLSEV